MASGEFDLRRNDYQEEFVEFLKHKHISNLDIKSGVVKNETYRTIFWGWINKWIEVHLREIKN